VKTINEAVAEAAGQAGGVTGIPFADKAADLTATVVAEGPSAAVERVQTGATAKAATLFGAAQNSSRLAYNSVAQWLESRERNRANKEHSDLLDRMERGDL
jgi:hypothetical protein